MKLKAWFAFGLSFSVAASATPAPNQIPFARVSYALARTYVERTDAALKNGVTADYLYPLLKAHFRTDADHRYLDGLREASPGTYKFKSYRKLNDGYALELASGAKAEVRADQKGRTLVNGHAVDLGRLTAEGAFDAVWAQMQTKHARLFSCCSLFPEAEALGMRMAASPMERVAMHAIIAGGIAFTAWLASKMWGPKAAAATAKSPGAPVAKPKEVYALAGTLDEARRYCQAELGLLKFADSGTANLFKFLNEDDAGAETLAQLDCSTWPEQFAQRVPGYSVASLREGCVSGQQLQSCHKKFQGQSLDSPAPSKTSTTPSAN